jgi:hypothetical protein
MIETSDLVRRLRTAQRYGNVLCEEAADRLEELEAENKRLRAALDAALSFVNYYSHAWTGDTPHPQVIAEAARSALKGDQS